MNQAILHTLKGTFSLLRSVSIVGRLNLVLFCVAAFFFFGMLKQVGWGNLQHYLGQVGYSGLLIFIPYGIMNLLTAIAWQLLLVDVPFTISLSRLFFLRLAGESLNQLTPTASLGGEPFKAFRLTSVGIPWQQATASLVLHKGLMVLSLVVYVFFGLALVPFVITLNGQKLAAFVVSAMVLSAAGVAFVVLQNRNPCASVVRILDRWGKCPAFLKALEGELQTLDETMAGFHKRYAARYTVAFVLLLFNWLLQGFEVYLIFLLLGKPVDWQLALCLDALAMLFTAMGFFIPVQLGVQDGGNVLLSLGFKLGAVVGMAFSLMRRIREALWLLVGLMVVTWEK